MGLQLANVMEFCLLNIEIVYGVQLIPLLNHCRDICCCYI